MLDLAKKVLSIGDVEDGKVKALTVLDFGCGSGLLSEYLQGKVRTIVCVDASSKMCGKVVDKIEKHSWHNVTVVNGIVGAKNPVPADIFTRNAEALAHNRFDVVFASSVLSFVPDLSDALLGLRLLLRPGGLLIHSDWLNTETPDNYKEGFNKELAAKWYTDNGFSPVHTGEVKVKMMGEEMPVFLGVAKSDTV